MPKIIVLGDSTVSEFNDVSYYYPRFGYGALLNYYFKNIEIINLALSGRSSKSFIVEDNYKKYLEIVDKDDFVIIGFGHNDEKSDDSARFTSALLGINENGSFKKSLYDNYIKKALDKGATPIICTQVPRLDFTYEYKGNMVHINENGDYRKAVLDLANDLNITGVDLTNPMVLLSKRLKDKQILLHAISKGKMDNGNLVYDSKSVDKTHLNYFGAKWAAYYLASYLKEINHPIAKYLNELDEPKLTDLNINPTFEYKEYKTPNLNDYKPKDNFKCEYPYYGTAFGVLDTIDNVYIAKSDNDGFIVGTYEKKGKFNASNDGFAYAFRAIDKTKNFKFSASAEVLNFGGYKQTGFGLMLRGDAYINQDKPNESYQTNYIASGLITTDTITYINFSRENPTEIKKELNTIESFYKVSDTAHFSIERLGQVVTIKTVYNGKEYINKYIDFDYLALDHSFVYIGMFSTCTTVIKFSDVEFEYLGEAKEA